MDNFKYPWLKPHWLQFQSLREQSRLPHALLLRGPEGLGINQLASDFAASLLCKTPNQDGVVCGKCSDCNLIAANTHPDLHRLSVIEGKKLISVDQVRALIDVCVEKSHQGGFRVAIITPSHLLNNAGANALLKTLEEPGDDTVIILVSKSSNSLPATIRSRCQLTTIFPPAEKTGVAWLMENHNEDENQSRLALRLSNHAPLMAVQLLESEMLSIRYKFFIALSRTVDGHFDPTKLAGGINKLHQTAVIDWLYGLALDAQKFRLNVPASELINSDQTELLEKLTICNNLKVDHWMESITEGRRLLSTTSNINPQLIIEDLLFRWIAIFK